MKNFQWGAALYSFLAVASMCIIGVGVAERSTWIIVLSTVLVFVFMGMGFVRKKKLREAGFYDE